MLLVIVIIWINKDGVFRGMYVSGTVLYVCLSLPKKCFYLANVRNERKRAEILKYNYRSLKYLNLTVQRPRS